MESLCLFLLICCFTVINFAPSQMFTSIFLTISLLLPLLLFITRIYSTIKLYVSIKNNDGQLNTHQQKKLFNVINRLPSSQRDLVTAIIHKMMLHIKIPNNNEQDTKKITLGQSESTIDNDNNDDDKTTNNNDDDDDDDNNIMNDIDNYDDDVTTTKTTATTNPITDFKKESMSRVITPALSDDCIWLCKKTTIEISN